MAVMTALALGTLAAKALTGIAGAIQGSQRERAARAGQATLRRDMEGRNNSAYLEDYYADYLKRADSLNALRQMREAMREQGRRDRNRAVITGATPEATAARQYDRNRVLAGMVGNLGAMGAQLKQRAKDRYLAGANVMDQMENAELTRRATSGNNLLYNGIGEIGVVPSMAMQFLMSKGAKGTA